MTRIYTGFFDGRCDAFSPNFVKVGWVVFS